MPDRPASLAALLAQATPGPWRHVGGIVAGHQVDAVYGSPDGSVQITRWPREVDARLIALAPDMARLLVEQDALIDLLLGLIRFPEDQEAADAEAAPVRARFAEIERRAAQ